MGRRENEDRSPAPEGAEKKTALPGAGRAVRKRRRGRTSSAWLAGPERGRRQNLTRVPMATRVSSVSTLSPFFASKFRTKA